MLSRRFTAPASFVLSVVGLELGWSSVGLSVPLATTLLALSLSLGRRALPLSWFAVGLLNASVHSKSSFRPEPELPAELSGRVVGEWKNEGRFKRAVFATETIHQGSSWKLWRQTVYLSLAPSVLPPPTVRLLVKGYLRRAPPISNGPPVDPGAWTFWVKSQSFVSAAEVPNLGVGFAHVSRSFRAFVRRRYQLCGNCAESSGVALARALTLGEASALPDPWRSCLGRAGLSHLVALSGLHVGLLATLGWFAAAGFSPGFRTAAVSILVVSYLLMAGGRPSLVRAALMLLGAYGSLLLNRPPQPIHGLSCVATGMILLNPELARDLGFLLTVSATAGILGLAPRIEQACEGIRAPFKKPLSVTVAAQIATLPWALPVFHFVAPFSPLWNLAAIPWIVVALLVSIVWLTTLLISPTLRARWFPILDHLAQPVASICELSPRMFQVIPSHLGFWAVAPPLMVLIALLLLGRFRWLVITVSVAVMLLPWNQRDQDPQLVLLDVGQGEAIILRGRKLGTAYRWGWLEKCRHRSESPFTGTQLARYPPSGWSSLDPPRLGSLWRPHRSWPLHRLTGHLDRVGWPRSSCIDQIATLPGSRLGALWSQVSLSTVGRWRIETPFIPKLERSREATEQSLVLDGLLSWVRRVLANRRHRRRCGAEVS